MHVSLRCYMYVFILSMNSNGGNLQYYRWRISYFSMPCTNANHEVMMQYHDWDITLTLDDTSPFHNNFCSYCILGCTILLPQVKVSMFNYTCQTKDKHLWCFAHHVPLTANIPLFFTFSAPFCFLIFYIHAHCNTAVFQHWLANVFICHVRQNY